MPSGSSNEGEPTSAGRLAVHSGRLRADKTETYPQLRLSATSNGEQRVRVRVPNAQGFHRTTQFFVQEYLNLVDWKGLELPSTERKCKASVKKIERSPTVLAEWIELKEALAKFQAERGNRRQTTRGPMI